MKQLILFCTLLLTAFSAQAAGMKSPVEQFGEYLTTQEQVRVIANDYRAESACLEKFANLLENDMDNRAQMFFGQYVPAIISHHGACGAWAIVEGLNHNNIENKQMVPREE
ncbi:hypothetical protein [Neptuniibacter sp. QD37_11]|uniref:hypothetical protein n=1 Tax=Neptuniibacter sp. QD37_11 TaxID=3398209 RepID=UPI0039F469E4